MLNKEIQEDKYIKIKKEDYEKLLIENEYFKKQIAELKRFLYGQKTERFKPIDPTSTIKQQSLFDQPSIEQSEVEMQEIKYSRRVKKKKRNLRYANPFLLI